MRVLIGLSSWLYCERAEVVAPLQLILDVLRLLGGFVRSFCSKCLAANRAFVLSGRQLVHNNVKVLNTMEQEHRCDQSCLEIAAQKCLKMIVFIP